MVMPRAPMQQGSGYPGTWELSNVTRWVNREVCYVGRREVIHSAATPSLGAAESISWGGSRRNLVAREAALGQRTCKTRWLSTPQPPPLGTTARIAGDGRPPHLEGV